MSSNLYNQDTTTHLAQAHPEQVIPCYGLHPWFCHPISFSSSSPSKQEHYETLFAETRHDLTPRLLEALPDVLPLKQWLDLLRQNLMSHPEAILGEVGVDKSFKISSFGNHIAPHSVSEAERQQKPIEWTKLKVPMSHQLAVLEAQIKLAIDLQRAMSIHCVQAQGAMSELLARLQQGHGEAFSACPIDLHAFGGSAESVVQLQKAHSNVFFSFSIAINGRSPRLRRVIQAVAEDRLLLESDWPSLQEQNERLSEMVEIISEARAWSIEST